MNIRLLLLYLFISLLVILRLLSVPPPAEFADGDTITTTVRLLTAPQFSGANQQLSVQSKGQKITLFVPRFSSYQYGDLLKVSGSIKKKVLITGKTVYSSYYPRVIVMTDTLGWPYYLAGWVRSRISDSFSLYLTPEKAGLLMGVVFGINTQLDKELKNAFQTTGVTHVIAASGMNVTLMAGFLLPLLLRIFKRQQVLILTIVFLAFYAVLSGLSASIVRAVLMASIGFLGLIFGRQRTAIISFYLTGCIMILITPSVLSDIGFQLSFAATAGMLLIRPLLPSFSHVPFLHLIGEDLSATVAAQITTLPILVYYFHSLGLLSIVVNSLVLWTIPPMMIIGSLAALLALLSIPLGGIAAFIALPFLSYFLVIIKIFASFTPVVSLTTLPISLMLGYYLFLAAIYLILIKRKGHSNSSFQANPATIL